jgi:HPt (histidine-containing phosphotransfer) domain-containing protein
MDGYEATRRIRHPHSEVRNHAVPIVAMTARAMKGDREECLEAGMNDYVSKPVSPKALAEVLEKWLRRETDDYQGDPSAPYAEKAPTPTAEPEGPAIPVFDKSGLLSRLMGDEDLAREIIEGFLEDMPRQIRVLLDLVEDRKAELAGGQAHKIKGSAATVGGESLREVASAMEIAGQAGDMRRLQRLMPEVEQQFRRLQMAMKE